ncbi:MAG: pro-sigmaK processing inhibitor BofA family protein [Clostridiales bacterium]|nr:pro-sigmaK processing inhibitor BofA family protein [Clostridiales bacterium]
MEQYLYPTLFILSIIIFIFYIYKTHTRWLTTVCIRVIVGIALIMILNLVLPMYKISCMVGVNPITVTTIGLLGVPGLLLIYGSVYFFTNI